MNESEQYTEASASWQARKKQERDAVVLAQRDALRQVAASGENLQQYLLGRGRLGSHLTSGNAALVLQAIPQARDVRTFGAWREYGRAVNKGGKGVQTLTQQNGYLAVTTLFDVSQTYGNKPCPMVEIAAEPTSLTRAVQALEKLSPIPIVYGSEDLPEPVCCQAEAPAILCRADTAPAVLLQKLPGAILMACMEQHTPGVSEQPLARLYAAAVTTELCGRLGLVPDPDAVKDLAAFRQLVPEGGEREELEQLRALSRTFGDTILQSSLPQRTTRTSPGEAR